MMKQSFFFPEGGRWGPREEKKGEGAFKNVPSMKPFNHEKRRNNN